MVYEFGDAWSAFGVSDLFIITTNATVRTDGALVMGRGIARQARDRFPGLDRVLGAAVRVAGPRYGLLVSPRWPLARLGLFQVKHHWSDPADLELIRFSTTKLARWCEEHPGARVDLNFPGIGNGRLSVDVVEPIIEVLPSSVHVWRFRR